MTSVSLASQVPFVLSLFIYSITAGGSILAAQYWGKGDTESIEKIFGYMFTLSLPIMIIFFSCTMIIPEGVIGVFTDKEVFITGAIPYLRCASFSYVFMTLAMIYETLLKNVGFVKQCTIASIVIVFLNIFLNAVFIFGLFGAPEMGISGAALATSISNGTGFIICLIFNLKLTKFRLRFKNIFRVDLDLRKRFSKYTLPYTLNQLLWGFGFAMITVILGHLEEDVATANSIATIVKDLVSCLCYAIASGSVIVIGNELGANRLDKAKLYGDKLFKIGIISGIILGIVAAASSPLVIKFVNLSEKAEHFLLIMLLATEIQFPVHRNRKLVCKCRWRALRFRHRSRRCKRKTWQIAQLCRFKHCLRLLQSKLCNPQVAVRVQCLGNVVLQKRVWKDLLPRLSLLLGL